MSSIKKHYLVKDGPYLLQVDMFLFNFFVLLAAAPTAHLPFTKSVEEYRYSLPLDWKYT